MRSDTVILRCSDRAQSDLLARLNLRAADLWRELDSVQEQISEAVAYPFDHDAYASLIMREREILAELDRIDD
jgi:hypothetical protein